MTDYDSVDFFADASLLEDPYPVLRPLAVEVPGAADAASRRGGGLGLRGGRRDLLEPRQFSSCNSVIGPFAAFPVPLEGDDVGEIIDTYRDQLPMYEHMVTMDQPMHTRERSLIMRLLTPKRLRENETFMRRLADQQIDEFVGGAMRVHRRLLATVRHARGSRRPGRARGGPPAVSRKGSA